MTHTEPRKLARRSRTRRPAASLGTVDKPVTGEEVCDFIRDWCCIPEGRLIGKPFELLSWQREFVYAVYNNPHGPTRHAILTFGRKNGKTALAATLLLNHLCGKSYRQNSQLFSTAQSRDQAAILFQLAAKIVRMSPDLRNNITIRDTAKELLCPEKGTRYRALSAEASTAYGLSPAFVVHDELGQVRGARSDLYEALETATGAQENPLSMIISTQAPTDSDLLSILIDDATGLPSSFNSADARALARAMRRGENGENGEKLAASRDGKPLIGEGVGNRCSPEVEAIKVSPLFPFSPTFCIKPLRSY